MSNQPILIVEDEHIVAEDIKQTLISLGYRVVGIAASAEEALEKVAKDKPQLALMDIKIKGKIDGIETASLLYQNYGVPVVYLTAHADDETLSRAVKTSPYGYILKPFDEVELKVCLQLAFHKICREADGSLTEDQISIKHSPDSSAA
ncbi:MAG: response regulator, partial [Candidatus Dadabacteria bacterium]